MMFQRTTPTRSNTTHKTTVLKVEFTQILLTCHPGAIFGHGADYKDAAEPKKVRKETLRRFLRAGTGFLLDARKAPSGLKLHSYDFIPFAPADRETLSGNALSSGLPVLCGDIGQVTANVVGAEPIAYDKTLIHQKTKVIGLDGYPAR